MKTKQAVQLVLDTKGLSKYALAQSLGAYPISVNQWLRGTRMSQPFADKFEELYGITIDDTFRPPNKTS